MQSNQVNTMTRKRLSAKALEYRQILKDTFSEKGKVRAEENAAFLGIGVSTFWKYVAEGRIKQPTRYGSRVSVWDAEYIRELGKNGIPAFTGKEDGA